MTIAKNPRINVTRHFFSLKITAFITGKLQFVRRLFLADLCFHKIFAVNCFYFVISALNTTFASL
jgi:hypothetical protein